MTALLELAKELDTRDDDVLEALGGRRC